MREKSTRQIILKTEPRTSSGNAVGDVRVGLKRHDMLPHLNDRIVDTSAL